MNPSAERQQQEKTLLPDPRLLARQLAGLTQLLSLFKESRHALDLPQLGFIMVNESMRLLPYHQAFFWLQGVEEQQLIAISGVAQWDAHAPQVLWLQRLLREYSRQEISQQLHPLQKERLSEAVLGEWSQWSHPYLLWLPLRHPLRHDSLGGLLLARDQPWESNEQTLLQQLGEGYAQALTIALQEKKSVWSWRWPRAIWRKAIVLLLLLALLMLPVRQSVLAPATIVARQPYIVAAPLDGVVQRFHVLPNDLVTPGQPLFDLDPAELKHRFQVAGEELAIAQAQYQKMASKALQNSESGGELAALRAAMARAAAQAEHAKQLLQRLQVRAEMAGVVLFADVNQWLGRPVRIGERILAIADQHDMEMEILLPVADALVLQAGAETRLFLNTDPLHPLSGSLRYASYEAAATPEGVLAYRLRSTLQFDKMTEPLPNPPRLGLKGTAKLFGEEVPLLYDLLRRPLTALRQKLGL
ncbi:efflux RND transporter periplasmic adaptor subunit [Candidatus Magnetaquicoccus inordinatus]|uniref:efflux RND transporter periplasmic adaptor subunit n=1 Tax=Candidatus Magnetaquicoccus inordinatus TaxID=2496818 RepID=UPI00102CA3E3|nr:HlyD family efflux transporter periplasmic adaptor subunit [Candidatus Magnetaquicoccus inordinatus]